ncbi:pseudouridylate synthase RPUSD4, mitochondrial [Genypterus blacodes]|uniref:pseudouridylate synthase RPUSD4, mitochondrial n=1 Tax=Genypterus blacodes TaxID=154954 RepID=UPI003F76F430
MNVCRRIVRPADWPLGFNTRFSSGRILTNRCQCPVAAPPLSRRHANVTGTKPESASEPGQKPRLRAIDLARKIQQEKMQGKASEQEKMQGKASKQEKTQGKASEPAMSAQQKRVTDLKRFTLQLQNVHPNVLAKHLHRSTLYQNRDYVVINKPYGVPVKDDSGATSISSVLPVLCKLMDGMKSRSESQLFPCLGLEKETTGTLLLARHEEAVEQILNLCKNNQVQTTYWVITVGVPVPSQGVIDIPIVEKEVPGPRPHYKMALSPVYRMNDTGDGLTKVRAQRQAHPAATKYRVLDSSSGCSLVELQPITGVKHQMRVHMALALSCPILGDHKYSNWSKLAPQKLPDHVLRKLGLEQSKSRHLPLHLHARQLTLQGKSQADFRVSCPLPKYFSQSLSRLLLTLPNEKDPE